jgi:DNA-binding NtrC family response regulator
MHRQPSRPQPLASRKAARTPDFACATRNRGACTPLPIRHTPAMSRTRRWGEGKTGLIVGLAPGSALPRSLIELGFEIETAATGAEALLALERRPFSVVLASQRAESDSLAPVMARAGQKHPAIPVVALGASAAFQDAVDCMQQGAADYLAPPFSPDVVVARLHRLLERSATVDNANAAMSSSVEHLGVVGKSAAMAKVFATIEKISRYKANVLLLGESGSGKELIARALHARGPRRRHLFVPINCATLGRDLLENELFGHERGGFTGAHERKRGLFELADGGTLFLDEIGELDPSTQAKLLRVLERNAFRRVGGTSLVSVDLSVIAATNRNLEEAIVAKKFREDLYYRLKVVTIVVPPLRERREDIPALVEAFIADFNRRSDGKIKGIAPQAMRWLTELPWPGNVRELKNAVESAAMLASSETIGLEEFESTPLSRRPVAATRPSGIPATAADAVVISSKATLDEAERLLISEHLKRSKTKAQAAQSLGIGLRTLYSKMKQYRLADSC